MQVCVMRLHDLSYSLQITAIHCVLGLQMTAIHCVLGLQITAIHCVLGFRVPNNVCFGKGTQKGFHRPKHWHQQNKPQMETKKDIENIDMSDLMDSTWKLDT